MKRVLIIDDEALARSLVREFLEDHPGIEVVAECENGFEGYKAIQQFQPDLVFLDVQMPKITGFEMLELMDTFPKVIFTTAYDEYAIRAFEMNAVDYLLKPFSKERFNKAMEKFLQNAGNLSQAEEKGIRETIQPLVSGEDKKNRIVVRSNSEIVVLPVNEIHYLEAYDDYVKIFSGNKYYLKKSTLGYFEQVLDPKLFFRVHRSFLVNIQQLTGIEAMEKNSYLIRLRSGGKIPLSRNKYAELKQILGF